MKNILDEGSNKTQAIIKLQIAKENLEGVDEALSEFSRPRIEKAISIVNEVLSDLLIEGERGFTSSQYAIYEKKEGPCYSCECNPCDCDWGEV